MKTPTARTEVLLRGGGLEATVDNDRITYYRVNAKISFELEGR